MKLAVLRRKQVLSQTAKPSRTLDSVFGHLNSLWMNTLPIVRNPTSPNPKRRFYWGRRNFGRSRLHGSGSSKRGQCSDMHSVRSQKGPLHRQVVTRSRNHQTDLRWRITHLVKKKKVVCITTCRGNDSCMSQMRTHRRTVVFDYGHFPAPSGADAVLIA